MVPRQYFLKIVLNVMICLEMMMKNTDLYSDATPFNIIIIRYANILWISFKGPAKKKRHICLFFTIVRYEMSIENSICQLSHTIVQQGIQLKPVTLYVNV